MAKYEQRIKALELRRRGKSIIEIARRVKVSKSTASLWCRDIILTSKQKEALLKNSWLAGRKGRLIGAEANKRKRLESIRHYEKLGKADLKNVSKRDLLVAGVSLYWAEGSKTGNRFVFINSDPDMIKLMYKFLTEVLKVKKEEVRLTVQINEIHRPRIKKVLQFWSNLLKLPLAQFGNPYYVKVKPKKVYENYDNYYGILRLRVRGGANLQYRILGLIKALKI
jgi:hypothetical protein